MIGSPPCIRPKKKDGDRRPTRDGVWEWWNDDDDGYEPHADTTVPSDLSQQPTDLGENAADAGGHGTHGLAPMQAGDDYN